MGIVNLELGIVNFGRYSLFSILYSLLTTGGNIQWN